MEAKRLIEICNGFAEARNKFRYCQGLIGELKLSVSDIDSTQTEDFGNRDEVRELARKIEKAVCTKLRELVYQIASEKGIVAVGKPLPKVGYWGDGKSLIALTKSGMFGVAQDVKGTSKKRTHRDPLMNLEFIAMLK